MRITIDIEPSPSPSPNVLEVIERLAPMLVAYFSRTADVGVGVDYGEPEHRGPYAPAEWFKAPGAPPMGDKPDGKL